ncbi:hypothetical protein BGZ46_001656 [Entomortierella lignicola]|nr:hypothetical protein BGZ46_001656 [Entomortierella lignicola]
MASTSTSETSPGIYFGIIGELESITPFIEDVPLNITVDGLKKVIKDRGESLFANVGSASTLILYRVSLSMTEDTPDRILSEEDISTQYRNPMKGSVSKYFQQGAEQETIHILVKRPEGKSTTLSDTVPYNAEDDDEYSTSGNSNRPGAALFKNQSNQREKRDREGDTIEEYPAKRQSFGPHVTADGETVRLPPFILSMLENKKFQPDPRAEFFSLRSVKAGCQIKAKSLGQSPKFFAEDYQGDEFIVTEQMIQLWEEINTDCGCSVKKCLSGPMGVGKSYIAWFLAAKAYAHGWPVLYIADAKILNDALTEEDASIKICQRFLSLNKDILTAQELGGLVDFEDKSKPLVVSSAGYILQVLLRQLERKTLLIVDEHGAMFPENKLPAPTRFDVLGSLDSFSSWNESIMSRVIFTGTAHGRFERAILRDAPHYLEFVGPLSSEIFNKLLSVVLANFNLTIRQHLHNLRDEIQRVTGCVPRELNNFLGKNFGNAALTADEIKQRLKDYETNRRTQLSETLKTYYNGLRPLPQSDIRKALADVFLQGRQHPEASLEWKFLDFGIVYQYWNKARSMILNHPITPASEAALLNLYKSCPLPNDYIDAIAQGTLKPADFSDAFFQKLVKNAKIILKSTNLAGKEEQLLELRVDGFEYLQEPPRKFGDDGRNILINGGELPRFDFMLGYIFIQVSVSTFQVHNNDETASFDLAFTDRKYPDGRNQIEYFLDHTFGGVHRAVMKITELPKKSKAKSASNEKSETRHRREFTVTRNGQLCRDFMILYIRGKNSVDDKGNEIRGPPNHTGKVQEYPQIRHVCWDEVKKSLFD